MVEVDWWRRSSGMDIRAAWHGHQKALRIGRSCDSSGGVTHLAPSRKGLTHQLRFVSSWLLLTETAFAYSGPSCSSGTPSRKWCGVPTTFATPLQLCLAFSLLATILHPKVGFMANLLRIFYKTIILGPW